MNAAAVVLGHGPGHDALLPRAPGGNGAGAALAVLVHAGLVAALTVSVDWRTRAPEVVSAELWASVPQIAAPAAEPSPPVAAPAPVPTPAPAPPPAPAPRAAPQPAEPDIATERAERHRVEERRKAELVLEREREKLLEKERDRKQAADNDKKQREKAAAAAREAKAAEERLVQQREENLRRMMAQAGGGAGTGPATSTGSAAQSAAPSSAYAGKLVALIRGNLVFTGTPSDNNAAEVEVTAGAGGTIISRRLVKSSGHQDWDEAVLRAIDRTATLPRDVDGRVPSRLIINFRPRE